MTVFRFDCVFYYVFDLDRAVRFYQEVLGLKLTSRDFVARFGGRRWAGAEGWIQRQGVLAVAAWSGVVTWILLKVTDAVVGMRVQPEEETEGLDTVLHNEKGHNL